MKNLTLYLLEDATVEKVVFGDVKQPPEPHSGNVGDALLGFYLLIAINVLAEKDEDRSKEFVESDQARYLMKALYDVARRGDDKNWLRRYFGENPKDLYTKSYRSKGEAHVEIIGEVLPRVVCRGEGATKEILISFLDSLVSLEANKKLLIIEMDVIRKGSEIIFISNRGHTGSVRKGDVFDLVIRTSYPAYFCVVWIDSEGKCFELCPDIRADLERKKLKLDFKRRVDGTRFLKTPSNRSLKIDTERGIESCLVFTLPREFKRNNVNALKARLRHLIADSAFNRSKGDFGYVSFKLEDEKRPARAAGFELAVAEDASDLIEEIVEQMHGFANEVHILSIPHDQSSI